MKTHNEYANLHEQRQTSSSLARKQTIISLDNGAFQVACKKAAWHGHNNRNGEE